MLTIDLSVSIQAADMVEKLLVPIADEINEHKQLQLRSLAAYNGTLRDENYGRGGRRFGDQEDRGIVCGFCGEPSHPTSDCPMRSTSLRPQPLSSQSPHNHMHCSHY